jgi:hypothetical protein
MVDVHSHLKWSNDGVAAGWGTKTNATFIAQKKLEHRGRNKFVCSSVHPLGSHRRSSNVHSAFGHLYKRLYPSVRRFARW